MSRKLLIESEPRKRHDDLDGLSILLAAVRKRSLRGKQIPKGGCREHFLGGLEKTCSSAEGRGVGVRGALALNIHLLSNCFLRQKC